MTDIKCKDFYNCCLADNVSGCDCETGEIQNIQEYKKSCETNGLDFKNMPETEQCHFFESYSYTL